MDASARKLPIWTGPHGPKGGDLGNMGVGVRRVHRRKGASSRAERKLRRPLTVDHHTITPAQEHKAYQIHEVHTNAVVSPLAQATAALRPQ